MRQPPRHFAPRRNLLRANERRDVVEHQHRAFVLAVRAGQPRGGGRDVQLAPLADDRDLLRERVRLARAPPGRARR